MRSLPFGLDNRALRRTAFRNAQDMKDFCRAHSPLALQTLVDLTIDPTTPAAVRKAAASDILDRAWGKAVQQIVTEPIDDMKTIEAINEAEEHIDELMNAPLHIEQKDGKHGK